MNGKPGCSDYINSKKRLKVFAKELSKRQTKSEVQMGILLKNNFSEFNFRVQYPILGYIPDFYCKELALAIEVDGSIHTLREIKRKDEYKDRKFYRNKITLLRFTNYEVLNDRGMIIQIISSAISAKNRKEELKAIKLSKEIERIEMTMEWRRNHEI